MPLLLRLFPRARFVFLHREPVESVRSLVQVKQSLSGLVGLEPPLDTVAQVEETVEAHRRLMDAFNQSRHLIPVQQLIEVDYKDLVGDPLATVEQIYRHLNLDGWHDAQPAVAERVAAGRCYRAQPVRLDPEAEERLQTLMQPAGAGAVTGQTPPDRRR